MKKRISLILLVVTLFTFNIQFIVAQSNIEEKYKPIPSYAKWGILAIKNTKEKYPNAKVIDYLHIGRSVGNTTSIEKFKLWLKENNKEYGVFIYIEFTNDTEKVIEINFEETSY